MDLHRYGAAVATAAGPVSEPEPAPDTPPAVVVLQSFPDPRPTTNPYIVMLARSLRAEPGVALLTFSWRRALFGRYDVFHVHWPEILVSGHSALKTIGRQGLFALLMLRLTLTRTPVVRTVHNLERSTGLSGRQRVLLDRLDRRTTLRVLINGATPLPAGQRSVTIPHGHYADWFAEYPLPASETGRIGFVGLIRPYKGVGRLISCFRDIPAGAALRLDIAGSPDSDALAGELRSLADGDDRITLTFAYISDADLVDHVGRAELVVLPYTDARNSGGALTALSLRRPVLLPDNVLNRRLRDEVGGSWVSLYDGELSAAAISAALESVRRPRTASPEFDGRDWADAGRQHAEAYRQISRPGQGLRRYSR
jgi:beta-1,4-mannosyltransferase